MLPYSQRNITVAQVQEEVRQRGGRFHGLHSTMSHGKLLQRLAQLRHDEAIQSASTTRQVTRAFLVALVCKTMGATCLSMLWRLVQTPMALHYDSRRVLDFRTNTLVVVEQHTLSCFDAALVHATACPIDELGIGPLHPHPDFGMCFKSLNRRLWSSAGLGNLFLLCRPRDDIAVVAHVFRATTGCFVVHCLHYHAEDMGIDDTASIAHYIVYNADARVLFLYPEVRLKCMLHNVAMCAPPTMEHARRCWCSKRKIPST